MCESSTTLKLHAAVYKRKDMWKYNRENIIDENEALQETEGVENESLWNELSADWYTTSDIVGGNSQVCLSGTWDERTLSVNIGV